MESKNFDFTEFFTSTNKEDNEVIDIEKANKNYTINYKFCDFILNTDFTEELKKYESNFYR